ncbi:MAG TPA: pyridoxal phosphate-dependent aminotransferase [Thermoanaerobaculia bacterium]|nr:pyridoxal phosphate-dependent aminotransferase [Thermoanaerobaculia bacterium]
MRLSNRTPWDAPSNRLTRARQARDTAGLPTIDLTRSNPTTAGLSYPLEELSAILGRSARASYSPDSRGLLSARQAIAAELSKRGSDVSPDDLILTASTSEAYSFLFKLLCNPGDSVLVPVPSYPLLEHLAALESVAIRTFPLTFHSKAENSRWALESHILEEALDPTTSKAIVAIHPNNPTGSYLGTDELNMLESLCAGRAMPLISDEVFFDYPILDVSRRSAASLRNNLSFSLGGLSKSAGLPHWKLGWIQLSGPEPLRRTAVEGLELIADTFLSVSSPVQVAVPELLALARDLRASISARTRTNLNSLRDRLRDVSLIELLPVEGGWSAVLRLPSIRTDEELALALLERQGVLIQPGYFFDFPQEGFVVLSLLGDGHELAEGVARIIALVEELCSSGAHEHG